jgi:hypothetical protein
VSQGEAGFVATLRKQMDNLYAQKRVENGRTLLPQMYGDPRGHKSTGREEWYHWTPNLHIPRLTEIYLWSMDRRDLERIPVEGWIAFLEGKDAGYPEQALRADLERVRSRAAAMDRDDTTPDTRLADYLMGFNPAATDALAKLTMGAYLAGNIWTLHARVRYFDPAGRRPGLPEDVAALVEKFDADSTTLTLVNTNAAEPREVVVQAGAYAEHQMLSVNGQAVGGSWVRVRLGPGAGGRLECKVKRYANAPTLRLPWER